MKDTLRQSIEVVKRDWEKSPYYQIAERHTGIFWDDDSDFRHFFDRLDLSRVVELACGHGRHSERIAIRAGRLILIDVFPGHLKIVKRRLEEFSSVMFILGNGADFRPVPDGRITAIVCYDSMVHFSPDIVISYLRDAKRVLAPGGLFLAHLSNFDSKGTRQFYGLNPQARNHMTLALLEKMVDKAGLRLVDSLVFTWSGVVDLDRIALIENPG